MDYREESFKVHGRIYKRKFCRFNRRRSESCITQSDAYTVKELFQRHAAGNMITCNEYHDNGNGARDFNEMTVLDTRLEGDLTDIDVIESYIRDYKERKFNHQKQQQNGKQQESIESTGE